jgi:hypothetical protein
MRFKRCMGLKGRRDLERWRDLKRWRSLKRRRNCERGRRFERWRLFERRRRSRHVLNCRPFPLAGDHRRLVENAGDSCERVVGRVALTHDSASGSNSVCGIGVPVAARYLFLASE